MIFVSITSLLYCESNYFLSKFGDAAGVGALLPDHGAVGADVGAGVVAGLVLLGMAAGEEQGEDSDKIVSAFFNYNDILSDYWRDCDQTDIIDNHVWDKC